MRTPSQILLLALFLATTGASAQDKTTWLNTLNAHTVSAAANGVYAAAPQGFALYYADAGSVHQPYWVYVPRHYDGRSPKKLLLFLHGAILARDSFQYADPSVAAEPIFKVADELDAIILFPFARYSFKWGSNDAVYQNLLKMIDQVRKAYNIDPKGIYAGGQSMGGNATWWLLQHLPDAFAGFYMISSMPPADLKPEDLTGKPIYTLNAEDDQVFPYRQVAERHNSYKAQASQWHYGSVPTGGHRFIYADGGAPQFKKLLKALVDTHAAH